MGDQLTLVGMSGRPFTVERSQWLTVAKQKIAGHFGSRIDELEHKEGNPIRIVLDPGLDA
jgi:hypothetical protein